MTGAAYFDAQGNEHFQRARAVVVSANGGETPRLLLNSANPHFPQGLGNSSGLVGKYLMFNYTSRAVGVFEHELNEYKSVQVTRILHDFYDSDPKRGFYGGGGLDARIGPQPTIWALRTASDGPGWGQGIQGAPARIHALDAGCLPWHVARGRVQQRDASIRRSRMRGACPRSASPTAIIPDDLATARFLQDRGAEILDAAGAQRVVKGPVTESSLGLAPARHLPHGERSGQLGGR